MLPNVASKSVILATPIEINILHNSFKPTGSPSFSPTKRSAASILQVWRTHSYYSSFSLLLSFYSFLLFFHSSILLTFYLSITLSFSPFILLSFYPFILLPFNPFVLLSFYTFILLSFYAFIHLFIPSLMCFIISTFMLCTLLNLFSLTFFPLSLSPISLFYHRTRRMILNFLYSTH